MVLRYYFHVIDANTQENNEKKIDLKKILNDEFSITFFSISPDSSKIIFNSILRSLNPSKNEIHTINLDGTDHRKIHETDIRFIPRPPFWSPDGNYILFTEFSRGHNRMKIINIDSDSGSEKYKIEEITDLNNNPINGIALNWMELEIKN